MRPLILSDVADKLDMIDAESQFFYNTATGEFAFYSEWMDDDEDPERFEDDVWISAPRQRDIGEYDMMVGFAGATDDPRKNELLCVALEGKGAFRRFKDTLHRVDLVDEWFAFKRMAYAKVAREWCTAHGIAFTDDMGVD